MNTPFGGMAQKRKPPAAIIGLAIPDGPPRPQRGPSSSKPAPPGPAQEPEPMEAETKPPSDKLKPGESWFVNQDQVCAKCEHFEENPPSCKKGVPEADFSTNDPASSRCRFFEVSDEGSESPAVEAREESQPGMSESAE